MQREGKRGQELSPVGSAVELSVQLETNLATGRQVWKHMTLSWDGEQLCVMVV